MPKQPSGTIPGKRVWSTVDITKPIPGYIVVEPTWYLCVDGDPTKALFYMGFPQRNSSKAVVDALITSKVFKAFTNVSAVFLEISYSPVHTTQNG